MKHLINTVNIIKFKLMWEEVNNTLVKTFKFRSFVEEFGFMTKVALIAEKMDHHTTWSNTYNKVEIQLTTHSAGSTVTQKDHDLAKAIDELNR